VVGSGRPSSGGCFPGPGGEQFDRRKRRFAVSGFFFSLDEEGGREPSGLGAADE
jgi:hypothetical protein